MGRRKAAYKKNHQNRAGMLLITLVVLMLLAVVGIKSRDLKEKIASGRERIEELNKDIESEEARAEEIEELDKRSDTLGYIEDMAKEKLGLVYEDEIVFKKQD